MAICQGRLNKNLTGTQDMAGGVQRDPDILQAQGGRGKSERRESRNQLRPQGSLKRRVSAEAVMPGLRSVGQEERRSSSVFSIPRSKGFLLLVREPVSLNHVVSR